MVLIRTKSVRKSSENWWNQSVKRYISIFPNQTFLNFENFRKYDRKFVCGRHDFDLSMNCNYFIGIIMRNEMKVFQGLIKTFFAIIYEQQLSIIYLTYFSFHGNKERKKWTNCSFFLSNFYQTFLISNFKHITL